MSMIKARELLEKVLEIENEQPVYRTGGTGDNGTCDCIGAVMGGMYRLGRAEYPLHSSNYFARYQTDELREIGSAETLLPGEVVYKSKDDPSELHARYLPGGTHCTGDTRNYYHAGMVVSASPLIIVHCTSSGGVNGFTRDERLGGWRWAGRVRGVSYEEDEEMNETAVVTVTSGTTVNLRIRPSQQSRRVAKVHAGTQVTITEQADGWAKVITPQGEKGYMMTQFLKTADETIEARLSKLEERVLKLERGE